MTHGAFTYGLLLCLLLGCGAKGAATDAHSLSAAPAAPATVVVPRPLSDRLSHPAAKRIVAIGDLHGDLVATKRALRLAGAIDSSDAWIGGALVVVQTGDEIDRGDDDRAVLDFLEALTGAAKKAGGALHLLSGNHEVMNVARDFRYVTPGGFSAFSSEAGRGAAFEPGGPYARMFAKRSIMARVGDTLFVHGGILPKHVDYGLDRMNDEVAAWMRAERPEPPPIVAAEDGLIWTRAYSAAPAPTSCDDLKKVLTALRSKRMVVGHTVQTSGINAACDGQVWRIDVGLAKFYGGPTQVLDIQGDAVSVIRE